MNIVLISVETIPPCVLEYDLANNSIRRLRSSCNLSPERSKKKNGESAHSACSTPADANVIPKGKVQPVKRGRPPLSKERQKYNSDMQKIEETNNTAAYGKPEMVRTRQNVSWTEREQKAWLNTYATFMDKKQLTKESCKWKVFSKQLKDDYGIEKDNVQCSKQVA